MKLLKRIVQTYLDYVGRGQQWFGDGLNWYIWTQPYEETQKFDLWTDLYVIEIKRIVLPDLLPTKQQIQENSWHHGWSNPRHYTNAYRER